jgi:hypothetical protein
MVGHIVFPADFNIGYGAAVCHSSGIRGTHIEFFFWVCPVISPVDGTCTAAERKGTPYSSSGSDFLQVMDIVK